MALYLFDTTVDTAGTNLQSHTLTGTGATGGPWINNTSAFAGSLAKISAANRAYNNNTGNGSRYVSTTAPSTADYAVECDVYVASAGAFFGGPIGRSLTGATQDCYWFTYNNNQWTLYAINSSGGTAQIATSSTRTIAAGSTHRVRLEMQGTAIRGYVDGVLEASGTNSAVTRIGAPGFDWYDGSSTTGVHATNFLACDLGGTLTAGTPTVASTGTTTAAAVSQASGGTFPYTIQWQRAPDSSGSPGTYANVGSGSSADTLADTGLTNGNSYWYRYTVTDSAGSPATATSSGVKITAGSSTLVAGAPTSSALDIGSVTITAAPSGGTAPYSNQFQRAPDSSGSPGTYANVGSASASTTLNDTGLTIGTTYWYRYIVTDSLSATATSTGISIFVPSYKVIIDGDSIPCGAIHGATGSSSIAWPSPNRSLASTDSDNAFTSALMGILGPNWCGNCVAFSGRPLGTIASGNSTGHTQLGDYTTNIRGKVTAAVSAGAKKVIVLNAGEPTNMIAYPSSGTGTQAFRDSVTAALQQYGALVIGDGAAFVTASMLARNSGITSGNFQTDWAYVNAWMQKYWTVLGWAALVDAASDSRFGTIAATAVTAVFEDATHPTTNTSSTVNVINGAAELARLCAVGVLQAATSPSRVVGIL